jgi:hypothetical protein
MVTPTVSSAKNRMRKVIAAIVDPWPRSEKPIWDYFGSECAYCGIALDRTGRRAHMDHAVAGGGNHLGNLILSCAICNGDEKRDEGWREFIERKVADADLRATRIAQVEDWIAMHPRAALTPSPEVESLRAELDALVDTFGEKCTELKATVDRERALVS